MSGKGVKLIAATWHAIDGGMAATLRPWKRLLRACRSPHARLQWGNFTPAVAVYEAVMMHTFDGQLAKTGRKIGKKQAKKEENISG